MNKGELIDAVAEATNDTKAAAAGAVDAVLGAVAQGLARSGQVQLAGFGTFKVAERPPHKGRNPRTGETIDIPASKTIKFHPSQRIKAEL